MRELETLGEPSARGPAPAGAPLAAAPVSDTLAPGGSEPIAPAAGESWGVLAATFADEDAAAGALQQLIDAGHDGALVAEEREGTVLYEVRLGPYPDRGQAELAAAGVRDAFRFAPTVYVEGAGE
jgi:cell division septation protein DedD